jgi:hypothetical protein
MASLLPSIRCSDCGVDVELSMMGEHVCLKQTECKIFSLGPVFLDPFDSLTFE